jgi:hypothetical protein
MKTAIPFEIPSSMFAWIQDFNNGTSMICNDFRTLTLHHTSGLQQHKYTYIIQLYIKRKSRYSSNVSKKYVKCKSRYVKLISKQTTIFPVYEE